MSEKMGFFILKSDKLKKDVAGIWPLVDVVATLVCREDQILAVYNERWGAFTLPMSKRRRWKDPQTKAESEREEEWEDAAVRVAAEWLGQTTTEKPQFLLDLAEFQQSDRDEKWKRYHMQAFRLVVPHAVTASPGRVTEWLTAEQILDENRRPISATARYVVAELHLKGLI